MEYIKTPKVDNVVLVMNHSRSKEKGTLYLTATHLIFVDVGHKSEHWVVHSHIQNVEKLNLTQAGSPLRLRCKNFQVLNFMIAQERDCHDLYTSLVKLSKPVRLEELYAFSYNPRELELQSHEGWELFKLNNEFIQMGLPTRHWKVSRINQEFGLCETYPKLLCVPSLATPALLTGSAAFRSKRRLPVLSYMHSNGATIVRCSQPMSGLNSRSIEDEAYVDLIRRSKSKPNDFMYIVDTRPMINAMANRAQGKGYENMDVYENIKYHFLGIDNIHVMRSSLNKLLELCSDSNLTTSAWLDGLNSSGWQRHVHSVLQVSRFIAQAVGVEGRSVLVHCSDGWDRTAQTCALASIMLNPHYRTIDGLLALVQKEWIHFGHKFQHRCGHLDGDGREVAPIFTQFVDAVWQLKRIRPRVFQFNDRLLFDLHDHAYSCQFGTFLGNCAKDRVDHKITERTYSLWGWIVKRLPDYTNAFYNPHDGALLLPPTSPHFVKFWLAMYNRHSIGLQPREDLSSAMNALNRELAEVEAEVTSLTKARNLLRSSLGLPRVATDGSVLIDSSHAKTMTSKVPRDQSTSAVDTSHMTSRGNVMTSDAAAAGHDASAPLQSSSTTSSVTSSLVVTFNASANLNDDNDNESVRSDPVESGPVDPIHGGSLESDPVQVELGESNPAQDGLLEAAPVEDGLLEAAPVEGGLLEAAPVEGGLVEAAPIEGGLVELNPVQVEPVESDPVEGGAVKSELVHGPVKSDPVPGGPLESEAVPGGLVEPDPVLLVDLNHFSNGIHPSGDPPGDPSNGGDPSSSGDPGAG